MSAVDFGVTSDCLSMLDGLRILILEDEFLIAMDVEQLCRDHGAADVVIARRSGRRSSRQTPPQLRRGDRRPDARRHLDARFRRAAAAIAACRSSSPPAIPTLTKSPSRFPASGWSASPIRATISSRRVAAAAAAVEHGRSVSASGGVRAHHLRGDRVGTDNPPRRRSSGFPAAGVRARLTRLLIVPTAQSQISAASS